MIFEISNRHRSVSMLKKNQYPLPAAGGHAGQRPAERPTIFDASFKGHGPQVHGGPQGLRQAEVPADERRHSQYLRGDHPQGEASPTTTTVATKASWLAFIRSFIPFMCWVVSRDPIGSVFDGLTKLESVLVLVMAVGSHETFSQYRFIAINKTATHITHMGRKVLVKVFDSDAQ